MVLNFGINWRDTCSQQKIFYDYTDWITGVSYGVFYFCKSDTAEIEFFNRDSSIAYDGQLGLGSGTITTTDTLLDTYNIDLEFEKAATLNGDFIALSDYKNGGNRTNTYGDVIVTITFKFKLYHYDGTTETLLNTDDDYQINVNYYDGELTSKSNTHSDVLQNINISSTRFLKGEKLRLKIEIWGVKNNINGGTVTHGGYLLKSKWWIPFKTI